MCVCACIKIWVDIGILCTPLGIPRDAIYKKFTNAFILERAATSTLPFAIDDPSEKPIKGSDINDVVVDLYNRGKVASLRRGAVVPKSIPLVATNYKLRQEERCVLHPFY